ncbi:MAG: S-layer homology domain-containing protein [Chloroflexota bacterium]|nr:S-layer homology domain-containing protein [Chloroflexota bacterium]
MTLFPLPIADSYPDAIVTGADGNLWFTEQRGYIGRITATGELTEFLVAEGQNLDDITAGPDNALWFTHPLGGKIGRISLTGTITETAIPENYAAPIQIVRGSDGNFWFSDYTGNNIWRMTPAGVFTPFARLADFQDPSFMALGSDGAIWFTERDPNGNRIGRITTNGDLAEYPLAVANSLPAGITSGPDGALWFLEDGLNRIGRITVPIETVTPTASVTAAAATTTPTATRTATEMPTNTGTATTTLTAVPSATVTRTPTLTPVPSATPCVTQFTDVPVGSTFYSNITCLVCRGIVGGYSDAAHCPGGAPCFQVGANVTRGQMSKFVAGAAGYSDAIPAGRQTFSDVPHDNVFWLFVERAYAHGVIGGYTDAGHCPAGAPCFQPGASVTRGQTAKFVAGAVGYSDPIPAGQQTFNDVLPSDVFWVFIERVYTHGVVGGYTCGNPEPCPGLYFRPANPVTRGQTAKFISNAFFPNCQIPLVR